MPNLISLIQLVKQKPFDDARQSNKIQPNELDQFFEQLDSHFPKLKFEEMTKKEIELYCEKFLQVHSLRCKKCRDLGFRCQKSELLINISEIF